LGPALNYLPTLGATVVLRSLRRARPRSRRLNQAAGAQWEPTIDSNSTQDEQNAAAEYTKVYGGTSNTTVTLPDGTVLTLNQNTGTIIPAGPALNSWYPVPGLSMAYIQSPDLVPTAMSGGSSGDSPGPETVAQLDPAFNIDLAALMSWEQYILNVTSNVVDEYQNLRQTVGAAMFSSSFFGQNVGYLQDYVATTTDDGYPRTYGTEVVYDILDSEGVAFAKAMHPQMELLLQQVGVSLS
jgi:hypothetical protein